MNELRPLGQSDHERNIFRQIAANSLISFFFVQRTRPIIAMLVYKQSQGKKWSKFALSES